MTTEREGQDRKMKEEALYATRRAIHSHGNSVFFSL
jgi:hypothetical protein